MAGSSNEEEEEEEEEEEGEIDEEKGRRKICNGCERPSSVRLCDHLPSSPIETSTSIIVLQHPHEAKHRLSTVPLLSKFLLNAHVVVGRRLCPGSSPLLDSIYSEPPERKPTVLFLFPGPDALDFEHHATTKDRTHPLVDGCISAPSCLIAFDGTWKHAKEMMKASLPFLLGFSLQVSLKFNANVEGDTIFTSDLILRKEPYYGCISTMEAVARSLRIIEPHGLEIERRILAVLRAMVAFQACHLKPMNPRHKLLKKGRGTSS